MPTPARPARYASSSSQSSWRKGSSLQTLSYSIVDFYMIDIIVVVAIIIMIAITNHPPQTPGGADRRGITSRIGANF